MFCGNCGKPLADNAKFCGGCGKSLVPGAPKAPVPPAQKVVLSAPQGMKQQSNGQQYQNHQQGQQYQGQQSYGQQPQPYDHKNTAHGASTTQKKRKNLVIAAVIVSLIAVTAIAMLLWFYVFNNNPLEGTCWVSEDGAIITFTDDKSGYYEDGGGKAKFTYSADEDRLSIRMDGEEEINCVYREEGDWLVLTDVDSEEELAWCSAEKAYFCAYCEDAYYSDKHTGRLDGKSYDFCDNCWDEVQKFLD